MLENALLTVNRLPSINDARNLIDQARRDKLAYYPSPVDWRDEILYFLLPDRFSDGNEGTRPLLTRQEINGARQSSSSNMNWAEWAESGNRWQGGTIKGITSKLQYISDLGITTVWLGPVFKQRARMDTYHGYGIQDFLELDPRFGTKSDLMELVGHAHDKGIKIVLDVIINHSGNNWGYIKPFTAPQTGEVGDVLYKPFPDYYGNPNSPFVKDWTTAWRNETQTCFDPGQGGIVNNNDGIWPKELQDFSRFTRAGEGSLNDNDLGNPNAEHKRTDFFDLKDFALDADGTLNILIDAFKYWIALTDCDGLRIDSVKHITIEEARNFCGAILEFTETIGKRNFLLIGEIAGGDDNQDYVMDIMEQSKRNLKAALDIGSFRPILEGVGKGSDSAQAYLEGFKEQSKDFSSHRSFGDRHVSILNDHDHVSGEKTRFSAKLDDNVRTKDYHVVVPTAIQLFTLGLPCIYYGTEQAFSGPPGSQLKYLENQGWGQSQGWPERYLRECMFGPQHPRSFHGNPLEDQLANMDTTLPGFGAFGTSGKHCFDYNSPAFLRISHLCEVKKKYLLLRTGRQYAREIRVFGNSFSFPLPGELIAWSRILDNQEAVIVINPNAGANRGGDVFISPELWSAGTGFTVVANTDQVFAQRTGSLYNGNYGIGTTITVQQNSDPHFPVYLAVRDVAPAQVIVFARTF